MCNEERNCNCECIADILRKIVELQKRERENTIASCDRPFLGDNGNCCEFANTRPVTLFSCCSMNPWIMPFTVNETESESTVFRCEAVDDCCATFRVLAPANGQYIATNSFFTMNLNCVGIIQCLPDTFVSCL